MYDHFIMTADESYDELNNEETIDDILDWLMEMKKKIMGE